MGGRFDTAARAPAKSLLGQKPVMYGLGGLGTAVDCRSAKSKLMGISSLQLQEMIPKRLLTAPVLRRVARAQAAVDPLPQ